MRRWRMLRLVGLVALLATSCGTGTSGGPVVPTTEGTEANSSMRPMASDDSIALLPGGKSLRDVGLSNVYIPTSGRPGTVLEIHPSAQPMMVQVSKIPSGGNLLVCPVDRAGSGGSWAQTGQPCIPVTFTTAASVKLAEADGNTHVAMEFAGTWKFPVSLKLVDVSYTAVDDRFYVEFAIP